MRQNDERLQQPRSEVEALRRKLLWRCVTVAMFVCGATGYSDVSSSSGASWRNVLVFSIPISHLPVFALYVLVANALGVLIFGWVLIPLGVLAWYSVKGYVQPTHFWTILLSRRVLVLQLIVAYACGFVLGAVLATHGFGFPAL
ncbi:MAG: hypothetical protein ACYDDR_13535 [Acidithiobacillus ferrivorans]